MRADSASSVVRSNAEADECLWSRRRQHDEDDAGDRREHARQDCNAVAGEQQWKPRDRPRATPQVLPVEHRADADAARAQLYGWCRLRNAAAARLNGVDPEGDVPELKPYGPAALRFLCRQPNLSEGQAGKCRAMQASIRIAFKEHTDQLVAEPAHPLTATVCRTE